MFESSSTSTMEDNRTSASQRNKDFGKLEYGCHHYRRRCKIRAPCCNQIFPCRHCHNDAASSSSNPKDHHELIRQDVNQVTCLVCETEQEVSQTCTTCGVNMGEYFCNICKFFDDDTTKGQFHCDDCGICRVGGRDNFFHCPTCGSCYAVSLRGKHKCVKNSMKNYCPICYEYLFDSIKQARPLTCGHTMHMECSYKMAQHNHYRCPICSKSAIDMTSLWKDLDEEIEATPMPEEYRFEVPILCNDCNIRSKAPFHIFGHKCTQCKSYNTRKITARESNDSK